MRFLTILTICLLTGVTMADTLADKEAVKSFTESLMTNLSSGNIDRALDSAKPYFIVSKTEFDGLKTQLKLQAPNIEKRFGKSLSAELLSVKEVGSSLILINYLQKFERHVMVWKFYFYKPQSGWVLNTLKFDHKMQKLFK